MNAKSDYLGALSAEAAKRYEAKVTKTGLKDDPYSIPDFQWTENPESIPQLSWSDMMLYLISTPSPYTREEIKVVHQLA